MVARNKNVPYFKNILHNMKASDYKGLCQRLHIMIILIARGLSILRSVTTLIFLFGWQNSWVLKALFFFGGVGGGLFHHF